ncbi:MAG: DUF420 domain-containing protein [Thermoanaerobaculia bacterium]
MDLSVLPHLNASLNALTTILLLVGYAFIRKGRIARHRATMIAAFVVSILFLISYLVYHYQVGATRYPGEGLDRAIYLTILATHTVLAASVPVLAIITLTLALKKRYSRHRGIARWTLPIWLYVSATGVIVYWMLYWWVERSQL